jgi:hypothetical protein
MRRTEEAMIRRRKMHASPGVRSVAEEGVTAGFGCCAVNATLEMRCFKAKENQASE